MSVNHFSSIWMGEVPVDLNLMWILPLECKHFFALVSFPVNVVKVATAVTYCSNSGVIMEFSSHYLGILLYLSLFLHGYCGVCVCVCEFSLFQVLLRVPKVIQTSRGGRGTIASKVSGFALQVLSAGIS